MGCAATAKCRCGYEEQFLIGGGMLDFETNCQFPCLCRKCNCIVSVNMLAKRRKCPECSSTAVVVYDQDELVKRRGNELVAEWNVEEKLGRALRLSNGTYFCPSCESFDLTFVDGDMCWD